MTTPRGFRDRADDSLFTLLGDIPELVRNLVVAEVNAAKKWAAKTAKDAGIGTGWAVGVLFLLFWMIPVILTFAVAGFASWMPVWAAALVVLGILLVVAIVFGLLAYRSFKKLSSRENPGQAVAADVRIVKEAGDEF